MQIFCLYNSETQINGVIMTNLPLTFAMMQELGLKVNEVLNQNGRIYVVWAEAPTEYQREVAHGCVFYRPTIHQY